MASGKHHPAKNYCKEKKSRYLYPITIAAVIGIIIASPLDEMLIGALVGGTAGVALGWSFDDIILAIVISAAIGFLIFVIVCLGKNDTKGKRKR